MIRIEDMMDDDYRYIEEKFCVVGKHTGTEYALGQRVTIEVIRVDLDMRTVDFIIAGE